MIPPSEWRWYGWAGHFIGWRDCRFHLCTQIGDYLVSTVGAYLPDSRVRDVLAPIRGIALEGQGDDRETDWMRKVGYEKIGVDRTYETMVFRVSGDVCQHDDCGCGLPEIIPTELGFEGYLHPGEATRGHHAMCARVAAGELAGSR